VAAGVLSGIPSTLHSLVTGRDPFDSVRAAGTIIVADEAPPTPRLVAGLAAHGAITVLWTIVLAIVLPRRRTALWGALAGAAIAGLDLGIAKRRFPAIAALPRGAQVADHLAFGTIAGLVLGRSRRRGTTGQSAARSASG
jgi:hypothetical protein